ncbi:hypothetical protein O0I10_010520 [Lichtheimia ornata]|uniref:Myb-like domain-containing protein n=1 Tax=Lichtheimia ornata TaxID=688661 RepID=A0AAD7XR96_9FUNG|nr:uncharacterized protein O0I10_010520 [Lichtheimia ornata]KAJ8653839.1 hypothetical protein O0I10_010520 [Lichtheimia ornata]
MPPKNNKKQQSIEEQQKQAFTTSHFFHEDTKHAKERPKIVHWQEVIIPDIIKIASVVERLRSNKPQEPESNDDEDDQNIPLKDEKDQSNDTTADDDNDASSASSPESQKMEVVHKESFFSEELTEEEKILVAKRVAEHQKQFAAYERRERARKAKKIRAIFDHVENEEIAAMLRDCDNDEEEVVYRLTQPGYLHEIRKSVASKYVDETYQKASTMTDAQKTAYDLLVKKRSETLRKTTNDNAKRQYRMGGRLCLDEAVKQAQKHQEEDPEKAFEGWSEARIRAYQMINENPNSYYYRFNAPGEVQRRGQWSKDEQKLFYKRLDEVGANGQWGIFSMAIPGRVGYQCSNFYRLLVETKQIHDPNYVLDERGKAHYLFDKKTADGGVKKTFRSHNKHSSARNNNSSSNNGATAASSSSSPSSSSKAKSTATTAASSSNSNGNGGGGSSGGRSKKKKQQPAASTTSKKTTLGLRRRRGKDRRWGASDSPESSDDDYIGYDDDRSGSYTMRLDDDASGRRRSKRQRRPTTAAIEAGLVDNASPTANSKWKGKGVAKDSDGKENDATGWGANANMTHATNPLPGFIDPITLEEVVKPAISKYGHVMGYESWVRCLTSWEGQRNICPLTKKPLSKRDLVVLDFDNIEEYRSRIVNM